MLVLLYLWVRSLTLDSIERRTLNHRFLHDRVIEHLKLTFVATLLVIVIAIPLGILLSRPRARWVEPDRARPVATSARRSRPSACWCC